MAEEDQTLRSAPWATPAPLQQDAPHFSDLQQRQPKKLAERLASQPSDQQLEALARRLVSASGIVWRKHAWLERSLLGAGVAVAMLTAAYIRSLMAGAEDDPTLPPACVEHIT